jgi:hypothetical protein
MAVIFVPGRSFRLRSYDGQAPFCILLVTTPSTDNRETVPVIRPMAFLQILANLWELYHYYLQHIT